MGCFHILATVNKPAVNGGVYICMIRHFSSVQFHHTVCLTLGDPMNDSTPGLPVYHQLPEVTQTRPLSQCCHLYISSCRHILLWTSIIPNIRVFLYESALHIMWLKYWSFSFNISPSNEHPGLISFRMDWLDLLAVQGTLKSLLQHHSSKSSILQHSAFFIVQLKIHT